MQFDDGSSIGVDSDTGMLYSTDTTGYSTNDPSPAPTGWTVFSPVDAAEAAKMQGAYPANGLSWDINAATMGISRVIDSVSTAIGTYKGTTPGAYAGQNGRTYASSPNPQGGVGRVAGIPVGLLLLGGLALLLMR